MRSPRTPRWSRPLWTTAGRSPPSSGAAMSGPRNFIRRNRARGAYGCSPTLPGGPSVLVLPAVDVRGGRCVRLIQGAADRERVYGDDPAAAARRWEAAGAPWVHVVDLDGAFAGAPVNAEAIRRIIEAVRIPVEVGGGMLKEACLRFGDRIAVAIDARDGEVLVDGWVTRTGESAAAAAARAIRAGARRIIYTDIGRDGMLGGPNVAAIEQLLQAVDVPVIASGGIASVEDVLRLRRITPRGPEGVVVGRALYEGRARLEDLLAAAA